MISYFGNFGEHNTERYIAEALEDAGIEVLRNRHGGDVVMYAKKPVKTDKPTISWVFDLYRGFPNRQLSDLKADIIITTDGDDGFHTVRQGIYVPEKQLLEGTRDIDTVFVGSPYYEARRRIIRNTGAKLVQDTRGMALNELLGKTKIVVGDSYPASNYWSNRVYEITGRGGFLIHPEVEGLAEEMPFVPQFKRGEEQKMVQYYLEHEDEREELRRKQFNSCPTYDDRIQEFLCLKEIQSLKLT